MAIYLYVKIHNKTNLKYFGKTIQDPYRYRGSGDRWCRHLKVHGNDVHTPYVWVFENEEQASDFAVKFSISNQIDSSPEWANLIIETAINDPPSMKGRRVPRESVEKSRASRTGAKRSLESRRRMSQATTGKLRGPPTESHRQLISDARVGKKWYRNQTKTECTCCFPGQEPAGWIPGMVKS